MDTHQIPPAKGSSYHPAMILAAIAVVLFCAVGTAAIMGWLPSSIGGPAASRQLSEADRLALAAGMPQGAPQLAQQYPAQPSQYPAQPYQQQALPPAAAPLVAPAPSRERAPARKVAQAAAADNWCANCGNIESIRTITTRASGSGLGAAGGAVLGGLLGNQVGSGNGRNLATVAGAVGGAVVGNQVEGNMKATQSYEIRVRLDDGTLRTFHQNSAPSWRTGERVRIVKGSLRNA
jgi:outer membrane lipoprotein SlyB